MDIPKNQPKENKTEKTALWITTQKCKEMEIISEKHKRPERKIRDTDVK